MRFLVDAQLSPKLARWFRSNGHDAEHVEDLLGPAATDRMVWATAQRQGAVLVSKDYNFVEMSERLGPPPQVLWVRSGNASNAETVALLEARMAELTDRLVNGEAVVSLP